MTKPDAALEQLPLREACLRVAARIIADQGVDALSMREVARRLGVSHQAPYKHYESRDHILAELIIRAIDEFAAALEARPVEADAFRDLEAIGRAYLTYASAKPLNYQLMFGQKLLDPQAYPALIEAGSRAYGIVRQAVSRLPRHAATPDASLIELDTLFAWSTVHGVASLVRSHAVSVQKIDARTLDALTERALQGITAALAGGSGRPA